MRWYSQSFLSPQSLYSLVVHLPAFHPQHRPSPPETPSGPLPGDLPESLPQQLLRGGHRPWWPPLRRSRLARGPARLALTGVEDLDQVQYCCPALGRAQKFPRDISLSISICNSRSATIRFSRWFSSRSWRSSLASLAFIPPYWFRQRWKAASLISSALATSASSLPSPSRRSPSRSFRTICSGVCFRPFIRVPPGPAGPLRNSHIPWISSRGSGQTDPGDMDPLLWTRFVRIEPFSKGDGHAQVLRRRVPPAGCCPGPLRAISGTGRR